MNKKTTCSIFATLAAALWVSAGTQLDMQSRATLRMLRTIEQTSDESVKCRIKSVAHEQAQHIGAFIKLDNSSSSSILEAEGVAVLAVRGNIALVMLPVDNVERIAQLDCVKQMQLQREVKPTLKSARALSGIDKIHSGTDLEQAYTGKGVITGIVDSGFDLNHVNFKDADGNTRIKYFNQIYQTKSNSLGYQIDEYGTPELIAKFKTDNDATFHGTHTLGIMAGGYRGTATVAEKVNSFKNQIVEIDNPYYGVAYESDIVASGVELSDMFIAYGVESVLNYAYVNKQPAVINLSLGGNIGPHDGKSMMGQYLALASKEAIICLASGNEGDLPIALNKTFSAENTTLKSFIKPQYTELSGYKNLRYGQVYVYSNDASEFTFKAVVYNKSRGTTTFEIPIGNTNGEPIYYATPGYESDGDKSHTNFNRAFEGYVGVGSMIDSETGRYYAMIDYFVGDNKSTNAAGNYILGFIVEGAEGQRVDCFCDGSFTTMYGYDQEGWSDGSTNGTVSDMACAPNVIVVGSYNSIDSWASLDGNSYGYNNAYPTGKLSGFTSYGTLIDGRNLPHICAPGATVISSTNKYYIDNSDNGITSAYLQAKVDESGRTSYWQQMIGTSMSTPLVTGSIALWLQADPSLTVADALDIIEKTAVVDNDVTTSTADPVQWGAGKFDAYAGLKEVIRRKGSGVNRVNTDSDNMLVKSLGNKQYELFVGGAEALNATVFNLSGQPVATLNAASDILTIDASSFAPGCYVVKVNDRYTKTILVK